MKSIIAKSNNSNGGLVFVNPAMLSKLTKDEFIVFNVVIVGAVLLIILSSYVLPRIAKVYWNSSKKLSLQNFRQIKQNRKIRYIFSKIFVPLKYVGFLESGLTRVGSSILVRNKIL